MIDVIKYDEQLKSLLSSKSIDEKDFKDYIASLVKLTQSVSKDAKSYTSVSPIIKKWTAAFKTIFSNRIINLYTSIVTVLYSKILKCYRKFEPDHCYECYREWRSVIASSGSEKRASAFITNIRKFELVVEHLLVAENRWLQILILELLQIYSKKIKNEDIIELNLEGCDKFLDIIRKVISLPQRHQVSVRDTNAFLSNINNNGNDIVSFQPYKIICENVTFIVTDYELWLDCNLRNKQITFVALSATDQKENVYGEASTVGMKIISNQDKIVIKTNWRLQNEHLSVNNRTGIVFCFSSRVHNLILESKLKNVFDIVRSHQPLFSVVGSTSRMADESMLTSLHEIGLVKTIHLQITPMQPINQDQIINQNFANDTNRLIPSLDTNDVGGSLEQVSKIQKVKEMESLVPDIVQDPSCNSKLYEKEVSLEKESIKTIGRDQLLNCDTFNAESQCIKKKFRKRRRDMLVDLHSTSSDNETNKPNRDETFGQNKRARRRVSQTKQFTVDKNHSLKEPLHRQAVKCEPRLDNNEDLKTLKPIIIIDSTISDISSTVVEKKEANTPVFTMQKPILHPPNDEKCIGIVSEEIQKVNRNVQERHCLEPLSNKFIESNTCVVVKKTIPEKHQAIDECLGQLSSQASKIKCHSVELIESHNVNTKPLNEVSNNVCSVKDMRNAISYDKMDKKLYEKYGRKGWHINRFFESLHTEEQEVIEDVIISDDMDIEIEEFYDSVSQTLGGTKV